MPAGETTHPAAAKQGRQQQRAECEGRGHHHARPVTLAGQLRAEDGVDRVRTRGQHRAHDTPHVGRPTTGDQQQTAHCHRRRPEPDPAGSPFAHHPPEKPREQRRRAQRDQCADGHPGALDPEEEERLVSRHTDRHEPDDPVAQQTHELRAPAAVQHERDHPGRPDEQPDRRHRRWPRVGGQQRLGRTGGGEEGRGSQYTKHADRRAVADQPTAPPMSSPMP
jgi:hypothetical protein